MPVGITARTSMVQQLEALEASNPEMPEGLLDLVRSCASSVGGGQPVEIFAIALKKGRLDRYKHENFNYKWQPVIATVTEIWNNFLTFHNSKVMVTP